MNNHVHTWDICCKDCFVNCWDCGESVTYKEYKKIEQGETK